MSIPTNATCEEQAEFQSKVLYDLLKEQRELNKVLTGYVNSTPLVAT